VKLQRLNLDNSWLLELNNLRVLIDPWLEGVEVDYFPWFNTQWHRVNPVSYSELPEFDLVLITQKYPDHFHKETLQRITPKAIIAPYYLKKQLERILPESEKLYFSNKQKSISFSGVEFQWFSANRIIDPIYDAYLISSDIESIFLAPHGYHFKSNQQFSQKIDLLITPFNEFKLPFFLGGVVAPGIRGISHLDKVLNPKYIVATHDEDKHAKGIVIKLAKVRRTSVNDLIQKKLFVNQLLEINHYNPVTL
jgi:hypothetical protein